MNSFPLKGMDVWLVPLDGLKTVPGVGTKVFYKGGNGIFIPVMVICVNKMFLGFNEFTLRDIYGNAFVLNGGNVFVWKPVSPLRGRL